MHIAGTIIGEKYRLEAQVGEGGMATVWRAVHTTLNRPVAIKFIYMEGGDVAARRERFLREAQLAASIRHRCVVDIVDFGHTDEGQPYMIMELLEGETLGERFDREPPLSVDEAVRIFDMLMGGLAAIHDKGVVHRDLKPDNIILTQDGEGLLPKLTDFGISRVTSRKSQRPPGMGRQRAITKPGLVLGTPEYLSPEQARGLAEVDVRSDVFSAGVLLYEALAGTLPFEGASITDLIGQIIRDEPPPLTNYGISPALSEVVQMAMAKDPSKRLQTARQLRMAMRAATRLTLADLNDSQLIAGPSSPAFIPLPVTPAASMTPVSLGSSKNKKGRHSSTAETLSGPPPASPTWPLWLAALAILVVIGVVFAVAYDSM